MLDKIKHWYYKRCLKKELYKLDSYWNDPDYYLCSEGSKQSIEIQKTENRIHFYFVMLYGFGYDKNYILFWANRYFFYNWWFDDAKENRRS